LLNLTFEGVQLTVVSHGCGGTGAAICFEELIHLGCKAIIRCGSCGSLDPKIVKLGDLMISSSSCSEDGHSTLMVPNGYPAAADPYISIQLHKEA